MRLIDADKLKNDMDKEERELIDRVIHLCSQLNEAGLRKLDEYVKMLLRMPEYRRDDRGISSWIIDRQPTAYDVDKVVEQLEVNSRYAPTDDEPYVLLDDAVRIVRSGGKTGR